jgi:hypothetical protein
MSNPETNKLVSNIETFKQLIKVKAPSRSEKLLQLVEAIEENLIVAPSSTRTEYHGAFPGGLVSTSLAVVKTMGALNKTYEAGLEAESIVVTGLFYDIGKSGLTEDPYYLPKMSDWHRQQGIMYEVNDKLIPMSVANRSLYALQTFGIWLSAEEHYAISSIKDRFRFGEESLAITHEPMLAVVLQQAVRIVCLKGSGKASVLS